MVVNNNNYKKKKNYKKNTNQYNLIDLIEKTNGNNKQKKLQDIINDNNINKNKGKINNSNKKKNYSSNAKNKSNIKKSNNIKKLPDNKNKNIDNNKQIEVKETKNCNIISNIDIIKDSDAKNEEIDDVISLDNEVLVDNDKNEKKETIDRDNTIKDIDNSYNNDEIDTKNNSSSKKNNNYIKLLLVLFIFISLFYIFIPHIKLYGDKTITISYDNNYVERGYKASFMFKNITKKIKVNNKVINGKIGNYRITYLYKLGLLTFKEVRNVIIIDNKKPEVLLDDEISICPNDDISKLKYEVFDEYDGDITNKAISKYIDNKLIITASDNSNNEITKEVIIKKEDTEKPVITLKGNETIYLNYGSAYYEPGYEAIDNCDGNISDKVNVSGKVNDEVGTYKITYSVSDSAGNKTQITRTIIIKNNYLYNSGSISSGTIYLTFDDGPSNGTTNVILDILKEEGVKATFFVTCNGPDNLIKRMYDEGHTVALHTATHNYSYVYSSVDNYFEDLNRVSNRVKNITGIESKIIRFPGGSSNTISRHYQTGIMTTLTGMVLDKGYRYFDWNVDSNDAGGARSSAEVYNNVTRNLSKSRSNVVLMHDIKYTTRDALRNIIKYGKVNGYNFEKIDMNTYMVRHGVNN